MDERILKYCKKHKDERQVWDGKEMVANPYFSEKKCQSNLNKKIKEVEVQKLAEKFLQTHSDFDVHQDFIKRQKKYL